MPLTTEEIEQLSDEPESVSVDGQSAKNRSADDVIKLDQYAAAKQNISTGSAWGKVRMAKAAPPGGAPH